MSAWLALGRIVGQKIVDFLPHLIVKRFYPPEKLEAHTDVDIRSTWNLEFRFDNIPRACLWLRVTNRSPYVDIQVDHVIVDIWDTQPLVKLTSSERDVIPRCTTPKKAVLCEADLNPYQVARLREQKDLPRGFKCYIRAYFESAVGRIERGETVEGVRAHFAG